MPLGALVVPVSELVHNKTGQWAVELEYLGTGVNRQQNIAVVHVDSIAHDALLSLVMCQGRSCDAEMRTMRYRSANPRGSEVAIRG